MPLFAAVVAFLLHVALVYITLQLIEMNWPALARMIKALIVSLIVVLFVGVFHRWLCGWLCS